MSGSGGVRRGGDPPPFSELNGERVARRIATRGRMREACSMRDSSDLALRIARVSSRASEGRPPEGLLGEMEDVLAEGYLTALSGEAGSRRLAERLERLVEVIDQPGAAVEARRVALEKRGIDADVSDLRARLALVHEQFVEMRSLSRSG